jgi:hypothetical protein
MYFQTPQWVAFDMFCSLRVSAYEFTGLLECLQSALSVRAPPVE